MKHLTFAETSEHADGRRIRRALFRERSLLPVSAACVVANAARELLGSMTGGAVPVRLFEPVVPDARAWEAVARDAYCFGVRGSASDAAIVLRPPDALALAAWLFGESGAAARGLSAVEESVLSRCVAALSGTLVPVCGNLTGPPVRLAAIPGMATYFELSIGSKAVRIGIALAREPAGAAGPTLDASVLRHVEIELRARVGPIELPAMAVAALAPGDVLPLATGGGLRASIVLDGAPSASGEVGVRGQRYAVAVDMPMTIEREQ